MSFSASWLALREPHDHAARAPELTERLGDFLRRRTGSAALRILDLACGSGSTFRYLAPRIGGPQHWVMVDNDERLLARLAALPMHGRDSRGMDAGADLGRKVRVESGERPDATLEAVQLDLVQDFERLPISGVDLVTASALLDLVSADWLDRLVTEVTGVTGVSGTRVGGPALLLALSYDGSMNWQPVLPDDWWVETLFNRHQLTDKGFGAALGPAAAAEAARRLGDAGFLVLQAPSPWRLGPIDGALQRELAGRMVTALADHFRDDADRLLRWRDERLAFIATGGSALVLGHTDLLALPPGSSGHRF